MARTLHDLMHEFGTAMSEGLTGFEGYNVIMEAGHGPRIYFTLEGAEGDATSSRLFQQELVSRFNEFNERDHDNLFDVSTSGYNKGDDLVIQLTVIFP